MNVPPHETATRTSDKEPGRTQNKNKTGSKAKHGQNIHLNDIQKETIVTDKRRLRVSFFM
jgi:hypothetical protein